MNLVVAHECEPRAPAGGGETTDMDMSVAGALFTHSARRLFAFPLAGLWSPETGARNSTSSTPGG